MTALERRLAGQLLAGGPSVRRLRRRSTLVQQGTPGSELFLLLTGSLAVEVDGERVGEVGPGAVLGELAVVEHDLVVVGVVPARLRDRADLLAMAATLDANPHQVAARFDNWRFGPTVAMAVTTLSVQRFRQVEARLGGVPGLHLTRYPGPAGRRTATLRAVTSCRVAVASHGALDRQALVELAEGRTHWPSRPIGGNLAVIGSDRRLADQLFTKELLDGERSQCPGRGCAEVLRRGRGPGRPGAGARAWDHRAAGPQRGRQDDPDPDPGHLVGPQRR